MAAQNAAAPDTAVRPAGPPCARAHRRAAPPATTGAAYVLIPNRLLEQQRHAPTTIGLYALVARLYLAHGRPVPLSRGDLRAYDPSLSEGVAHMLTRLLDAGWLIKTRVKACRQACYTPTWGLVGGQPRPWVIGPRLGKPRHVAAIALPRQLLDTLMGRISVAPSRPALIDRYLTAPALGLAEVGTYALAQYGYPGTAERLTTLGLLVAGRAVALPQDRALLLRVCQPPLAGPGAVALSPRGEQLLGWWRPEPLPCPPELAAAPEAHPFSGPQDLIGAPIADPIAPTGSAKEGASAAPSHESATDAAERPIPATRATQAIPKVSPPTPPGGADVQGQKNLNLDNKVRNRTRKFDPQTDLGPSPRPSSPPRHARLRRGVTSTDVPDRTPTIAKLRELNVYPAVIRELADLPLAVVEAACDLARDLGDLQNQTGWIVTVLRDAQACGWEAARARWQRRQSHPVTVASVQAGIAKAKASGLFRYDTESSQDLTARPVEEATPAAALRAGQQLEGVEAGRAPGAEFDVALTACLHSALTAELGASREALVTQVRVAHARTALVVACPAALLAQVEQHLRTPIERLARGLGLREVILVPAVGATEVFRAAANAGLAVPGLTTSPLPAPDEQQGW